jgi:Cdc6-like AAA superfamily ATPase
MITDARVLQAEFVPRDVEHRDPEVNALSGTLRPITAGERPETAILTGPSGAGKTCIAKFTVDRLREEVLDLRHQYVSCWRHYTGYRTLIRILEGLDVAIDVHRQSTPRDELVARLREYDGPPYVVVLDEVDQLRDTGVLFELLRIRPIALVLIANREAELFADCDERLVSRLQTARGIRFDAYSIEELVAILSTRVRWGLRGEAVEHHHLERIADAAAGDARQDIGILRSAARLADERGLGTLTGAVVDDAIDDGKAEVRRKTVDKLTPHQRALYRILDERGELDPGTLYGEYADRVEDPRTKRTVRNYLTKLSHYNLVAIEGEKRGRTYRPQR